MPNGAPTGLRERKKQRTRAAIVAAAMRLFAERGFDATTVADIAEAADVAPRTFFGYFATKEDVVFHDTDEVLERFGARLRDRPAGESTFDALRAWVASWLEEDDEPIGASRQRRALVRATPALQVRERADTARLEALVAEGVAADLGMAADELRPRLVAAAATAALLALDDERDEDVQPERALEVMDEALAFLRGGLDALRRRPPTD